MKPKSIRLIVDTSIVMILFMCVIGIGLLNNQTELKDKNNKLTNSVQGLLDNNSKVEVDLSKVYSSQANGELIEGTPSEIAARQTKAIKEALEKAIEEEKNKIVYDNLTMDQLIAKINKVFKGSYLQNTGEIFAKQTLEKGVDTYTAISIVLLETGCKWTCSRIARTCNNFGGMKGKPSCTGGSYKYFNTIEEGITGFINNLSKNYYKKGLDTPEKMGNKYANGSSTWAMKVNKYINEVRKI